MVVKLMFHVLLVCQTIIKYMRGVDKGDQLESYYNIGRISRKW